MVEPIAFVSRSPQTERDNWLKILSENLEDEKIVDFNDLKPADYGAIELAIVANPDPDQLIKLTNLKWIQSLWAGVERMVKELPENAPVRVIVFLPLQHHSPAENIYPAGENPDIPVLETGSLPVFPDDHFPRLKITMEFWLNLRQI